MEGTGISKLALSIRKHGYTEFDRFELATVVSSPPAIRVRIDNDKIDLEAGDIVIAEHLTAHNRLVSINGNEAATLAFHDELQEGDRVVVVSMNAGQRFLILDRMVMYGWH